MNWSNYPNFSEKEFRCKHTGECKMQPEFLERLQALRTAYGKSLTISSGYRSPLHPIEAAKALPGAHSTGQAADLAVSGADAYKILKLAFELGFTGIGVQQKGTGRFIHLDTVTVARFLRPSIWSY